jgi:hypothetical protein
VEGFFAFNNASTYIVYLGLIHTGSQVLSLKSLEVNHTILAIEKHGSWDLSVHTGSEILISKYDVDVYMTTLFGGEAWDLHS